MAIEIEKKFRLSKKQRGDVLERLPKLGATRKGEDFEVNTLYSGKGLDVGSCVLRLRRIGTRAILTYKERLISNSNIKHQREDETRVADPDAMEAILDALGFVPWLIYEKHRETWALGKTEIVIDELPFGLYMEIEGDEKSIRDLENKLAIKNLRAEPATYPQLTQKYGTDNAGVVESRFSENVTHADSSHHTKKRPRSFGTKSLS